MNKAMTHKQLIDLAVQKLRYRYDLIATEFSPYWKRVYGHYVAFDFIAFSRRNKEIRIIECKANRADFLADRKWRRYLPFCTHLAFFGPKEIFSKEELPTEIGIIRPLPDNPHRIWYYERGCRRLHEVEGSEYLAILEGFIGQYMLCSWNCQKRGQKPRYSYE